MPNIFNIWNDEGWITPEVEELYQPDRTILRLSFVSKKAYAEQKSAIESQKSAIETKKPAIESKKSAIETKKSAIETKKSAIETKKSAIESKKPAIESKKPAIESQKPAIESQKPAIEKVTSMMQNLKYNEPTRNNIEKVYSSIKANQVFGSADIKTILNCSDSTARTIIAKLRDEVKVIIAVHGQGKAKYPFINETDN